MRSAARSSGEAGVDGRGRLRHLAGTVEAATIAPLGRLLAYVWPAIVAAPAARFLAALPVGAGLAMGLLPRGALATLVREASQQASQTGGESGVAGLTRRSPGGHVEQEPSPGFDPGDSDDLEFLLVGCGVLTVLLIYNLRRAIFRSPL